MSGSAFELFIAKRYLRARRKEAVISVITAISIVGVAAGVMALVIALAVNNGFRNTLQRNLLGAMAHINVLEKEPGNGIEDWEGMVAKLRKVPHVTAASAVLYTPIFLSGPLQSKGAYLKGIQVSSELAVSDTLRNLKGGSLERLRDASAAPPGIVLGSRLAEDIGMLVNARVDVISPQGELTPLGPRAKTVPFRVSGLFESGFFEIDDNWAFASLAAAQKALSLKDVVNQIELKVDDLNRAPEIARQVEKVVGARYTTLTWMEKNKQLMNALKMERAVTIITIGLIELVAALNILITLVMMVMEKYKDIAILMSMGARRQQIRRIFMLQGVLIGVVGSAIGLVLGYSLCYVANRYRLVRLDETVYSLSFVPFEPRPIDGLWIAAAAILVSFLATIYPARSATRVTPTEVLRYE
jgi:lipoprotein-releasing system permease protein